eukprot:365632-Chlamydomonas_euryale.AAC.5
MPSLARREYLVSASAGQEGFGRSIKKCEIVQGTHGWVMEKVEGNASGGNGHGLNEGRVVSAGTSGLTYPCASTCSRANLTLPVDTAPKQPRWPCSCGMLTWLKTRQWVHEVFNPTLLCLCLAPLHVACRLVLELNNNAGGAAARTGAQGREAP